MKAYFLKNSYFKEFFWSIGIAILVLGARLLFSKYTALIGDEYLYWFWGKKLALGYPDHAPFVAYLTRASELLFGKTPWGIRFGSFLLYLGLSVYLYYFGKKIKNSRLGMILSLLVLLLPVYIGVAMIVTPDTPLVFFLFLSFCAYYYAFFEKENNRLYFIAAGLLLGLAMLSKLPAVLNGAGIFMYAMLSKRRSVYLKNPYFWWSFVLAAIVYSPFMFWNFQNDFIFIKFVLYRIGMESSFNSWIDFWSMQFLLYLPTYFLLFFYLIYKTISAYASTTPLDITQEKKFFFVGAALFPLAYLIYKSLTSRMEANWSFFAFVPLTFLLAFYLESQWKSRFFKKKLSLKYFFHCNNLLSLALISFAVAQTTFSIFSFQDRQSSRFYYYTFVEKEFKNYYQTKLNKNYRILSDTYRIPSIINFTIDPVLESYCFPLTKYHQNIYDLLYERKKLIGKNFYYLIHAENNNQSELYKQFENVELLETFTSYRKDKKVRSYRLYFLRNFLGSSRIF